MRLALGYLHSMDDKLDALRNQFPSKELTLRDQPALAVLIEQGKDVPDLACTATRRLVAVYGCAAANDIFGPGIVLLGTLADDVLEKRPRGRGAHIRVYPKSPATALTSVQVSRLRDLSAGRQVPVGARSRASALAAV